MEASEPMGSHPRLFPNSLIPEGDLIVLGGGDVSVMYCNPADEPVALDVLAALGEHFEVGEALNALRERRKAAPLMTERDKARAALWGGTLPPGGVL